MRDLPLLKYNWFILLWVEIRESQIIFITLFFFILWTHKCLHIRSCSLFKDII